MHQLPIHNAWMKQHFLLIEKLLFAIALAQPDQPDQMILRGPSRADILEEALAAIYPDSVD